MPKHDLDPIALVAGVVSTGIALVALIGRATGVSARWVVPVLLIALGVAGLVATGRRVSDSGHGEG